VWPYPSDELLPALARADGVEVITLGGFFKNAL
jgi:hypothetical protein